jgi:hypothetical protein
MPRPSLVTSSGPSPVRGFIAAILPSPSSRPHARHRGTALHRREAPRPRALRTPQSRAPTAEPASHNRFYLSPYYPVFGSRMVMIGHARCRPGARSGHFCRRYSGGRSAPAVPGRSSGHRAGASRDRVCWGAWLRPGPGGRVRRPGRCRARRDRAEPGPAVRWCRAAWRVSRARWCWPSCRASVSSGRRPFMTRRRPYLIVGSWRWRESNPRPSVHHQGFSGRSLLRFSQPRRSRKRDADRLSRCSMSRLVPRPGQAVIPLADARHRVEGVPGLTHL